MKKVDLLLKLLEDDLPTNPTPVETPDTDPEDTDDEDDEENDPTKNPLVLLPWMGNNTKCPPGYEWKNGQCVKKVGESSDELDGKSVEQLQNLLDFALHDRKKMKIRNDRDSSNPHPSNLDPWVKKLRAKIKSLGEQPTTGASWHHVK